jgi:hypothetical protein
MNARERDETMNVKSQKVARMNIREETINVKVARS